MVFFISDYIIFFKVVITCDSIYDFSTCNIISVLFQLELFGGDFIDILADG